MRSRNYFNVMDIEAYHTDKFVAYCICAKINNKNVIFYGIDVINKFIKWCEKEQIKEVIYCHNLTFDGGLILGEISKGYEINGFWFRSSIYEIIIKNERFEIKLRCSYKILPMALKKIGKLLENKNKLEIDHKKIKIENIEEMKKEVIEYCMRDIEITKEFLEKIKEEYIGNISIMLKSKSISSFSIKTYNEMYNKKGVNLETETKIDKKIRNGYYGGRCEVFGNPYDHERIFHYDFTGMYSQVMMEEFCFGNIKIKRSKKTDKPGFYRVKVKSNIENIPILPYRNNENGKLIFPNGEWEGTYWWEELEYFKKMGGEIKEIIYKIEFEKNEKIFEDFIKDHSELRKKSKLGNIFWKLFINSISGRLGMGEINTKETIIRSKEEYNKTKKEKKIIKEKWINEIGIITYENKGKSKKVRSNVGIAAAITSKARIKLHKAYMDVIKNGGRILYSDTDSIFAAFEKNVINEKHGEIIWDEKKNDTVIKKAIFALPKGYAIILKDGKEIIKLKGFRKESISFEEFENAFNEETEIIKKDEQFKKNNIIPNILEIEKRTKLNNYDKREFIKNKKESKPIIINQWKNEKKIK